MTATHLPVADLMGLSMVARPGDLDRVVASEYLPNILLFNDGRGFFADAPEGHLPLRPEVEETREVER